MSGKRSKRRSGKSKKRLHHKILDIQRYRDTLLDCIQGRNQLDKRVNTKDLLFQVIQKVEDDLLKFQWQGITEVQQYNQISDHDEKFNPELILNYQEENIKVDHVIPQKFQLFGGTAIDCLQKQYPIDIMISGITGSKLKIPISTDIDVEVLIPIPISSLINDSTQISSLTEDYEYTVLSSVYLNTLYQTIIDHLEDIFDTVTFPDLQEITKLPIIVPIDNTTKILSNKMALIMLRLPESKMIKIQLLVQFKYQDVLYTDNILEFINATTLSEVKPQKLYLPVTLKCYKIDISLFKALSNTINAYLDRSYQRDLLSKFKLYLHGQRFYYLMELILLRFNTRDYQSLLNLIIKFAVKIKKNHQNLVFLNPTESLNLTEYIIKHYDKFCWKYYDKLIPINRDLNEFIIIK